MSIVESLKRSYISNGLSSAQIEALAAIATTTSFGMGETVLSRSDESRDLYVLTSGRVGILSTAGDTLAIVGPGSIIGEIGLVDREPRSATVNALEACEFVVMPGDQLKNVIEADLSLAAKIFLNIARVLAARLRAADLQVGHLLDPTAGYLRKEDMWSF